jgi:hypothetical protein
MHGLFGFDPHNLSDDELMERITELNRRITWMSRYGSVEIIAALQDQRQYIEFERRERMIKPALTARANGPSVVVESDPDLAQEARQALEEEIVKNTPKKSNPKPFSISRDRIKPTARPTKPSDE